MAIFVD